MAQSQALSWYGPFSSAMRMKKAGCGGPAMNSEHIVVTKSLVGYCVALFCLGKSFYRLPPPNSRVLALRHRYGSRHSYVLLFRSFRCLSLFTQGNCFRCAWGRPFRRRRSFRSETPRFTLGCLRTPRLHCSGHRYGCARWRIHLN
jgi:hypothetical protein